MDLLALRTFKTVAESGGVTAAAERLCCVPSAVTTRLRNLEREVGAPLFVRESRGMTLTARGRILLDYAARALNLVEEAGRAVRGDEPRGELRIGATDSAATVNLPPVFARYHERHPNVALVISSNVTEALIEGVLARRIDCAVIARAVTTPSLVCQPIRRERLTLVSARSVVDVFSEKEFTFLSARAGGVQRARIEEWWMQSAHPPMRVIELPSLALRLSCAAAGMGMAALPTSALSQLAVSRTLRSHPIPEPWCWQDTFFIRRKADLGFAALDVFGEILFDEFKSKETLLPL